jgi:hypothetical protein
VRLMADYGDPSWKKYPLFLTLIDSVRICRCLPAGLFTSRVEFEQKCFLILLYYVIWVAVLEKIQTMDVTEDPCSRFRKWLCIATSNGGFTREIWSVLTHTGSVYKLYLTYTILLLFVQSERIFLFWTSFWNDD